MKIKFTSMNTRNLEGRKSNIEHATSNSSMPESRRLGRHGFSDGAWPFDVARSMSRLSLLSSFFLLTSSLVHAQAGAVLTTLYSFTGTNDGTYPQAALVQGSDGNFYGTTSEGGTNNFGTVFKISTSGALTSLYSFTNGNDGANPSVGLVQGSDGYFYGMTGGGSKDFGTVFKISTNGALTSFDSFTYNYDGVTLQGGLVQGSDGYVYGTTAYGARTTLAPFSKSAPMGR
jgi:uncharacterized repeat protein (TIGR03803 family)